MCGKELIHFIFSLIISVDSWLEGDNNNKGNDGILDQQSADSEERIYSGRTSPKKRYHRNTSDSAALHRGTSENTLDSFDNAYARKVNSLEKSRNTTNAADDDDFFDT